METEAEVGGTRPPAQGHTASVGAPWRNTAGESQHVRGGAVGAEVEEAGGRGHEAGPLQLRVQVCHFCCSPSPSLMAQGPGKSCSPRDSGPVLAGLGSHVMTRGVTCLISDEIPGWWFPGTNVPSVK